MEYPTSLTQSYFDSPVSFCIERYFIMKFKQVHTTLVMMEERGGGGGGGGGGAAPVMRMVNSASSATEAAPVASAEVVDIVASIVSCGRCYSILRVRSVQYTKYL